MPVNVTIPVGSLMTPWIFERIRRKRDARIQKRRHLEELVTCAIQLHDHFKNEQDEFFAGKTVGVTYETTKRLRTLARLYLQNFHKEVKDPQLTEAKHRMWFVHMKGRGIDKIEKEDRKNLTKIYNKLIAEIEGIEKKSADEMAQFNR